MQSPTILGLRRLSQRMKDSGEYFKRQKITRKTVCPVLDSHLEESLQEMDIKFILGGKWKTKITFESV
jgi:hypothetical protein